MSKDRQVLVNELKAISRGGTADYFLGQTRDAFKSDMLQGDGWRGFQLFMFDTGKRRSVQGLVISNSCDVDPFLPLAGKSQPRLEPRESRRCLMATKRADMKSFREKALSDPVVREENEAPDTDYKTQRRDRHVPGVSKGMCRYYSGSAL